MNSPCLSPGNPVKHPDREQQQTFTNLFTHSYDSLYAFIHRFVPQKQSAEDIAAEVFLELLEKAKGCSDGNQTEKNLFRTAYWKCLAFERREKLKREILVAAYDKRSEARNYADPREDLHDKLALAFETLPDVCGKIIRLSYLEEFTDKQIARRCNLSQSRVKKQKLLGIFLLKKELIGRICVPDLLTLIRSWKKRSNA